MGVPSYDFSDANAGVLEVTFTGDFGSGTPTSEDHWYGGGAAGTQYIVISCKVKQGSTVKSYTYISTPSPTAKVTVEYPGGSVVYSLSMAVETHTPGGISGIYAQNLKISWVLVKR